MNKAKQVMKEKVQETERIKKIMSKPLNPKTTMLYWISQNKYSPDI